MNRSNNSHRVPTVTVPARARNLDRADARRDVGGERSQGQGARRSASTVVFGTFRARTVTVERPEAPRSPGIIRSFGKQLSRFGSWLADCLLPSRVRADKFSDRVRSRSEELVALLSSPNLDVRRLSSLLAKLGAWKTRLERHGRQTEPLLEAALARGLRNKSLEDLLDLDEALANVGEQASRGAYQLREQLEIVRGMVRRLVNHRAARDGVTPPAVIPAPMAFQGPATASSARAQTVASLAAAADCVCGADWKGALLHLDEFRLRANQFAVLSGAKLDDAHDKMAFREDLINLMLKDRSASELEELVRGFHTADALAFKNGLFDCADALAQTGSVHLEKTLCSDLLTTAEMLEMIAVCAGERAVASGSQAVDRGNAQPGFEAMPEGARRAINQVFGLAVGAGRDPVPVIGTQGPARIAAQRKVADRLEGLAMEGRPDALPGTKGVDASAWTDFTRFELWIDGRCIFNFDDPLADEQAKTNKKLEIAQAVRDFCGDNDGKVRYLTRFLHQGLGLGPTEVLYSEQSPVRINGRAYAPIATNEGNARASHRIRLTRQEDGTVFCEMRSIIAPTMGAQVNGSEDIGLDPTRSRVMQTYAAVIDLNRSTARMGAPLSFNCEITRLPVPA